MALYLFSCSPHKSERDYQSLYNELARLNAVRVIEFAWLVDAAVPAMRLRNQLVQHLDCDDRVFVVEFTPAADWAQLNPIRTLPWMASSEASAFP